MIPTIARVVGTKLTKELKVTMDSDKSSSSFSANTALDLLRKAANFFAALALLGSTHIIMAQVSIIPLSQEVLTNPGGKTRFDLQIGNRADHTLSFTIQCDNLDISPEGLPTPNPKATEWSCADWISFSPKDFDLPPDSVQVVHGVIIVPSGTFGSRYAFISCRFNVPTEPVKINPEEGARAQYEFGKAVSSSLLVTVRSSKNKVNLHPDSLLLESGYGETSNQSPYSYEESNPNVWKVTLPVTNTGNIHTIAGGRVSIWSEDMRLVENAVLTAGKGFVLPGKTRLFKAQGNRPLPDGIYMVRVEIQNREGKMTRGSFPFYILEGTAVSNVDPEKIRTMMQAFTPRFILSKNYLSFDVTPNAKRYSGLRLTNNTQDSIIVNARPIAWAVAEDGRVLLEPEPSQVIRPCISWLTVTPDPLIIPPKGAATAKICAAAPNELSGEYYGAILFQTKDDRKDLPSELDLNKTVLITVSSATGATKKATVDIVDFQPISPLMRMFTVNIINLGNVHCYASGKLTVYDKNWKIASEPIPFGSTQEYLMPDTNRLYSISCAGALDPGRYKAVFEVKYDDAERSEVLEYFFDVD